MVLKRSLIFLLSLVVASFIGLSLFQSFSEPQVQDRLALAQTYLTLQASEYQGEGSEQLSQALLGSQPYETALGQYRPLLKNAEENLKRTAQKLDALADEADAQPQSQPQPQPQDAIAAQQQELAATQQKQQSFFQDLQLEAGLLSALAQDSAQAQTYWQAVQAQRPASVASSSESPASDTAETAEILSALWRDPPQLLPDAEVTLKRNLRGWFRDEALVRLYSLEQRQADLDRLAVNRQAIAQRNLTNLAIVVGLPLISLVIGIGVLLVGLVRGIRHQLQLRSATKMPSPEVTAPAGRDLPPNNWSADPSSVNNSSVNSSSVNSSLPQLSAPRSHVLSISRWQVPWDGAVLTIGILGGFFLVGQILISSIFGTLISAVLSQIAVQFPAVSPLRFQAISVFLIYSSMTVGVLAFLSLLLRGFRPFPQDWFRFQGGRWIFWGVCGYFVANPLVRLVSVINQQIWEGQGGSNPLLTLALENQDNVALLFFFVTAAIAAPIFEEIFFRGFLMASLTRFMPGWGAIVISALIFAAAHLSLSELLPLMTLGMVLGFVYGRSRNLLASILLHSLWNSSTLISLFLLGSALRGE